MVTLNDLKDREVVNICDGKRYGYVCDIEIDVKCGRIIALIVPGELKMFGFARCSDYYIPWECVERVGDDIILVSAAKVLSKEKGGKPVKKQL